MRQRSIAGSLATATATATAIAIAFAFAFVLLTMSAIPSASAAPSRAQWFTGLNTQPSAAPSAEAAAAHLSQHAAALQLTGIRLTADPRVRSWRSHRVVRFRQEHEGLPVFGRGVLVRLDRAGRASAVVTFVAERLDVIPLPVIDADEAQVEAAAQWGRARLGSPEAQLGVLDDGRQGTLVWRVDGNVSDRRIRAFVDAVSGAALRSFSLARSAPGRAYRQNPVATPTPEILELGNITGDGTHLEGRAGTVYHYVSGSVEQYPTGLELDQLATSDGTGFFYNPVLTQTAFDDPFCEVNLYYHLDVIDSYFRDVHGHVPFRAMMTVANYGEGAGQVYNNAFSTPITTTLHGLFFGQGIVTDFGYDGDVVYHEYGHFVVDEVSQMGYIDDLFDEHGMHFGPGGINEGLADYFSSSVMDESVTGEYAMANSARDLNNDLVCPDDVFGEPHEDGRIIGGVTWEIRTSLGASRLADTLMFGALTLLSPSATFEELSTAISATAAAMQTDGDLTQSQVDDVNAILEARGMTTCGRSLPLDDGLERTTHPFGFDWLAQVANNECEGIRAVGVWLPGAFQYRITVPADAQALTVRLRQFPADELLYRFLLRKAEPIGYMVQPLMMGLSIVFPQQYDFDFGEYESDDHSVTITTRSDPPLEPGATYYIAVLHQNCPDSEQHISARTSPELPPPDGGLDDASTGDSTDNSKSGCSCNTTTSSSTSSSRDASPILVLLLVAFLAAWNRRRRQAAPPKR
ncbi:MAG: hypothetical protein ABI333_11040 [bacterium]